jgi:hypothetical protein
MCDAGMDGDMYDPNTSSGKWVGTRPQMTSEGPKYPVQPLVLNKPKIEEETLSFRERFARSMRMLFTGK